jgi:glycosyltransferase involved in cell wall biosynthesis
MKTVVITINTSWNIYNFRLGLIKALQKKGYKVVAIAPKDDYSLRLQNEGIEYYHININNKGTNPIEDLKLIKDYYKIFKSIRPDAVLAYTIKPNIYASFAASFLKIPMINNISGLGTVFLNDNISSKIARLMYKTALKNAKKVFFQNQDDLNLFINKKLVNKNKTDLLPGSGINTEKFKPLNVDNYRDIFKFLFIARLVKDKGILEYINAAKIIKQKYKNIEFGVLGAFYPNNPTAIAKEDINRWQKENIINYLGVSDNVKDIINSYDCIVLPSYREGLSRVLLEAASMAKPIVTTNTPGCKDVVEDGYNGYLCKVKDSSDLAKKMEKMLNLSTKELMQMGNNGRQKVKNEFDEKIVIDKYLNILKEIKTFI